MKANVVNKRSENNTDLNMENKKFKRWLKLSYKRKSTEEHAGYYEYEGDFLTKEEMFKQWNTHFKQT